MTENNPSVACHRQVRYCDRVSKDDLLRPAAGMPCATKGAILRSAHLLGRRPSVAQADRRRAKDGGEGGI